MISPPNFHESAWAMENVALHSSHLVGRSCGERAYQAQNASRHSCLSRQHPETEVGSALNHRPVLVLQAKNLASFVPLLANMSSNIPPVAASLAAADSSFPAAITLLWLIQLNFDFLSSAEEMCAVQTSDVQRLIGAESTGLLITASP